MCESIRSEGEERSGEIGREAIVRELMGESEGRETRQDERGEERDVHEKNRVVGDDSHRRREDGCGQEVLRIGERAFFGEEDVRIEEVQGVPQHLVEIPGDDPRIQERVGAVEAARLAGRSDEREREEEAREREYRGGGGEIARAERFGHVGLSQNVGQSRIKSAMFVRQYEK